MDRYILITDYELKKYGLFKTKTKLQIMYMIFDVVSGTWIETTDTIGTALYKLKWYNSHNYKIFYDEINKLYLITKKFDWGLSYDGNWDLSHNCNIKYFVDKNKITYYRSNQSQFFETPEGAKICIERLNKKEEKFRIINNIYKQSYKEMD